MVTVIESIVQSYNKLIDEDPYADPRTKDEFLISSPLSMLAIAIAYVYFSTKFGPRMMEERKPFKLKTALLLYNVFQIIVGSYITVAACYTFYKNNYNWKCVPMDFADTPPNKEVHKLCRMYYLLKLIDFMDTVFFVLRKKNKQISTLHLFHHTLMFVFSWLGMRYFSTGHGLAFGILNCFVHVVMYSYYLVAGLGPQYQKYLWWKKYLTVLQLIQFGLIFFHNLIPLLDSSCTYPKGLHLMQIVFASTFIYMFGKFYINTYILKDTKIKGKKNE